MTTFNPDLALHFSIGKEILCYRSVQEAVELSRYYLEHEEEAIAIAKAGRDRALAEHMGTPISKGCRPFSKTVRPVYLNLAP